MKKKLIAAMIASGCLLSLQASASAQSFAFSGVESQELSAYYNTPTYWNYAPNALGTAPPRVVHHRVHQ
jgi:hypothetical protein